MLWFVPSDCAIVYAVTVLDSVKEEVRLNKSLYSEARRRLG